MDKTDRLRDYGLAFLLYEHGLGICGYELIRELFIFIKLILNSYLIKAADNKTDPNSFISVFKFEVKGKERRYQLAETGTFSKTESNNLSSVEYKAKKYGESSYYIVLEDLTAGEYGIVIGDPNHENTKNGMKVTTFTVE